MQLYIIVNTVTIVKMSAHYKRVKQTIYLAFTLNSITMPYTLIHTLFLPIALSKKILNIYEIIIVTIKVIIGFPQTNTAW